MEVYRIKFRTREALCMEMDAQLMDVEPETPVLIQYGTFFSADDIPVMTSRMVYLADMVEITYDVKDNSDTRIKLIS